MYAGVEKPARDAGKGGEELVGFTGILVQGFTGILILKEGASCKKEQNGPKH